GRRGPARREPRLSCGTLEGRLTVAPFRAWRGWASRVAQGRDPRPADPEHLAYYTSRRGRPRPGAGGAGFRRAEEGASPGGGGRGGFGSWGGGTSTVEGRAGGA